MFENCARSVEDLCDALDIESEFMERDTKIPGGYLSISPCGDIIRIGPETIICYGVKIDGHDFWSKEMALVYIQARKK